MLVETTTAINTDPIRRIYLGRGMFALVDPGRFDELNRFQWQARKFRGTFYAMRRVHNQGREYWIRMHRVIAQTPKTQWTHHKNLNPLDNRRSNLQNMFPEDHKDLHRYKVWEHMPMTKFAK